MTFIIILCISFFTLFHKPPQILKVDHPQFLDKTIIVDTLGSKVNFKLVKEHTFESIKIQAIAEDKIIFVDMYADWCGPCKHMDATVFNQAVVANDFNKSFINYKVDIEDTNGRSVARLYNVNAHPTYFFLKSNGEVLYRLEGVFTPEGMLEEAEFAKSLLH